VEDRHEEHAAAGPRVQPNDQDAGEEQGDELEDEENRRGGDLLDADAFLGEKSGRCQTAQGSATNALSFSGL
jgi:hypothetical protein